MKTSTAGVQETTATKTTPLGVFPRLRGTLEPDVFRMRVRSELGIAAMESTFKQGVLPIEEKLAKATERMETGNDSSKGLDVRISALGEAVGLIDQAATDVRDLSMKIGARWPVEDEFKPLILLMRQGRILARKLDVQRVRPMLRKIDPEALALLEKACVELQMDPATGNVLIKATALYDEMERSPNKDRFNARDIKTRAAAVFYFAAILEHRYRTYEDLCKVLGAQVSAIAGCRKLVAKTITSVALPVYPKDYGPGSPFFH